MPRPPQEAEQADRSIPTRLVFLTYAIPLAILIIAVLFSTRLFIVLLDEVLLLNSAAQPVRAILSQFHSGLAGQTPSPFYVLGLHFWLGLTGGAFPWLRIPSALFYLAGLCMLARVAYYWGKEDGATILLFMAAFWPFGFHYGALLTWYSFAFMIIAALTWTYFDFRASPRFKIWCVFCALGVALIYVTYVGWALLILFCIDDALQNRNQESSSSRGTASRWLASFAFLAAAYAPQWPAFFRALRQGLHGRPSWMVMGRAMALNAPYRIYVLLASESIAPWFWKLGLPVALTILVCVALMWLGLRTELRRLLILAGVLLLAMDLLGILRSEELMLIAPWFLLPLAVALSTMENRNQRRGLLISVIVIAGFGWYGIYQAIGNHDPRYYANGDFFEPWPSVAAGSGLAVREGGDVISNSPQFFFYLTYSLAVPPAPEWRYVGSLPETVRDPHTWDPAEWQAAGRPLRPYVLWVKSTSSGDIQSIDDAGQWLDQHCGGRLNRYIARDPSYPWAQKILPQASPATPWLIETHQYTCDQPPRVPAVPGTSIPPATAPQSAPPKP